VNPTGVTAPALAVFVPAVVGAVKYLINIWGEMTPSGALAGAGPVTGSLALNSSAGPLVAATGWIILAGGELVTSGGAAGMGGAGSTMGAAGGGGAMGAWTCSATGGGGTRKRKCRGPACGK
jgi:hypothetical protein